jgi:hypothetical protein
MHTYSNSTSYYIYYAHTIHRVLIECMHKCIHTPTQLHTTYATHVLYIDYSSSTYMHTYSNSTCYFIHYVHLYIEYEYPHTRQASALTCLHTCDDYSCARWWRLRAVNACVRGAVRARYSLLPRKLFVTKASTARSQRTASTYL